MQASYFTASSVQTMQGLLGKLGVKVDYSKHKDANVLIALQNGNYMLCLLAPPNRSVKVYLSDKDETITTDVVEVFKVAQASLAWSEL